MYSRAPRPLVLLLLTLVLACIAPKVCGQEPQVGQLSAPPPIKALSKAERDEIDRSNDSKHRLQITIEFARTHLAQAEKYTSGADFQAASSEIGSYHALIENALTYLSSLKRDSNKTRDLYKRLELSLRADGPRLTAMRRITPLEFAVWIKEAEDFARESRTEALNSFYGHTVVHEPKPESEKAAEKKDPRSPTRTP
jgi:hypothetical protein